MRTQVHDSNPKIICQVNLLDAHCSKLEKNLKAKQHHIYVFLLMTFVFVQMASKCCLKNKAGETHPPLS